MANKTRKAQMVLSVINAPGQSFEFLLLQTNEKRGSFWQNVTGKIEEGETIEEGGLREAIEETALNIENIVDILSLGLKYDFIDGRSRDVHEECFLVILDAKWKVKIDSYEHQDHKWVSLKDITRDSVKFESNYEALHKSILILKQWGG